MVKTMADPTEIKIILYFTRHLHKKDAKRIIDKIDKLLKNISKDYEGLFCELYNVIEEVDSGENNNM